MATISPFDALEKLRLQKQQIDPRQLWQEGIAKALDPQSNQPVIHPYYNDPVGFARDILGMKEITPDQQRMMESARDYETTIVKSATGVGKTYALAALAIWFYKTREKIEVYTAAAPPERNLKQLLWGELGVLIQANQDVFQEDKIRDLMITRGPKMKIEGVRIPAQGKDEEMEAAFSGKHQEHLIFIFDEGDAVPDPVYKGADGCMSGGNTRMIICYNPKKKEGRPYEMLMDGSAHVITMSAFNHPNVITGLDIIPGAVTRAKTLRRINEWTEPVLPDEEVDNKCFEVPGFLVGEVGYAASGNPYPPIAPGWRRIIDPQFAYKVLGDYPPVGADQLIQEDWLNQAVTRWESYRAMNGGAIKPPSGIEPIMGFDVAGEGPDRQSLFFRYGGWCDIPISHREFDPDSAAIWAARHYKERGASVCYVDMTGVGAGVPHRMIRMSSELEVDINAVGIFQNERSTSSTEDGSFYSLRDEAYWALREAFRTSTIMIPPSDYNEACDRLHRGLRRLTYEKRAGDIKIVDKKTLIKRLRFSPDELESLMLTFCPPRNWMGGI